MDVWEVVREVEAVAEAALRSEAVMAARVADLEARNARLEERLFAMMERAARSEAVTRLLEDELKGLSAAPAPVVAAVPDPPEHRRPGAEAGDELEALRLRVAALEVQSARGGGESDVSEAARSDGAGGGGRDHGEDVGDGGGGSARVQRLEGRLDELVGLHVAKDMRIAELEAELAAVRMDGGRVGQDEHASRVSALADSHRIRQAANLGSSPNTNTLVMSDASTGFNASRVRTPAAEASSFAALATPPSRNAARHHSRHISPIRMPSLDA